ncbi:MAG TPA: BadF/BadG/BcrA/BcrD ATPase family protein [Terriglobales bacterium]|nr:BadF/BadG/BcrA/BcrD ATPase family protein [Terriglobales bacterium]
MALYLGIDGGGTKTICTVGDENAVLGTGTSGGSNVIRLGEPEARKSVQTAILSACEAASVQPADVERTCIGVAGASVPQVREAIRRFISEIAGGEVIVVGDNEVALEAAFSGAPGVIVASGTGSIAYGRNEHGQTARAGGHGFAISDEGSGHWIGRAAVVAAMRAFDRQQDTQLHCYIQDAFQVETREQVVKVANATPPPNFARLFPLVVQAAESGDTVASEVLARAGEELAELAIIVLQKLWPDSTVPRVGIVGGVFQNSAAVRRSFQRALLSKYPQANVNVSVAEPVAGALSLARKGTQQTTSAGQR